MAEEMKAMNCLRKKISESKTATFQMRINPDVKKQAEEVFAAYGLTLTEAVNIFIHQSLCEGGLPFVLSPGNREYQRARSIQPAGALCGGARGKERCNASAQQDI